MRTHLVAGCLDMHGHIRTMRMHVLRVFDTPAGPQPLVVEEEDGVVSVFCVEAPFCVCRGEYVRVLFLHNFFET